MTQYLVFIRTEDGRLTNIGERRFDQLPRKDEFVCVSKKQSDFDYESLYKVICVLHVTSDKREITTNSGELYITPAKYEPGLEMYFPDHYVPD